MKKGKSTGLQIYEKHKEIVCRYIARRIPGQGEDMLFRIGKKVWEQAAINEQEFEKKTEKEQVCLLLAIVEQIIKNKDY
ncbi:MAG: hypothetical protein ACI4TF_12975 [Oliverpabstia sp.]